ncbi:hypothetical protein HGM15179_016130 [Zosterops borbonicus]|uniref:Uncharacterized protein n=1 Tax=Zosterops borbonicus TaxID=364589 RepID=A0A8K1LEI6_9PASS|nr:hypothetical protein HGM15179_016130 [Zosterops borbonicus]
MPRLGPWLKLGPLCGLRWPALLRCRQTRAPLGLQRSRSRQARAYRLPRNPRLQQLLAPGMRLGHKRGHGSQEASASLGRSRLFTLCFSSFLFTEQRAGGEKTACSEAARLAQAH